MDIDSSRHVHITNAFIDDDDDCISIKAARTPTGCVSTARPKTSSSRTPTSLMARAASHGQRDLWRHPQRNGTQLCHGLRQLDAHSLQVAAQPRGVVENITYKNIVLHGTREAFDMNMEWRMVGPRMPRLKPSAAVRTLKSSMSRRRAERWFIHGLAGSRFRALPSRTARSPLHALPAGPRPQCRHEGLTIEVKQGDPITKTDVQ